MTDKKPVFSILNLKGETPESDSITSLSDIVDNIRSVKGQSYTSCILIMLNSFNVITQMAIALGATSKEKDAMKLYETLDTVMNANLTLIAGVFWNESKKESVREVIDEMHKDYVTLVTASVKILYERNNP